MDMKSNADTPLLIGLLPSGFGLGCSPGYLRTTLYITLLEITYCDEVTSL